MPRSEEAWLWFTAVYEAVQEIPLGRVTSYGHIARLLGKRECFSRSGPIIGSLVLTAGSRKPSGMSTVSWEFSVTKMQGAHLTFARVHQTGRSCSQTSAVCE